MTVALVVLGLAMLALAGVLVTLVLVLRSTLTQSRADAKAQLADRDAARVAEANVRDLTASLEAAKLRESAASDATTVAQRQRNAAVRKLAEARAAQMVGASTEDIIAAINAELGAAPEEP